MKMSKPLPIYNRIRNIIEFARAGAARSVNTAQVVANWRVGQEIVEEEQKGKSRADYGEHLLSDLSARLKADYGPGYSIQNLRYIRQFYLSYPELLGSDQIHHAPRGESSGVRLAGFSAIGHAVRGQSMSRPAALDVANEKSGAARLKSFAVKELASPLQIPHALRAESWRPGQLHSDLSWTHYRTLLRADKADIRAFYEIEAIKNNWAARELERQINSLLYERLALS